MTVSPLVLVAAAMWSAAAATWAGVSLGRTGTSPVSATGRRAGQALITPLRKSLIPTSDWMPWYPAMNSDASRIRRGPSRMPTWPTEVANWSTGMPTIATSPSGTAVGATHGARRKDALPAYQGAARSRIP